MNIKADVAAMKVMPLQRDSEELFGFTKVQERG